jgi:hypothetical protein
MSRRPRNPVTVVKADIDDKRQRELRRARNAFEDRERLRGRGRRAKTQEPVAKCCAGATFDDRERRDLISKGFSEELVDMMLSGDVPRPERLGGAETRRIVLRAAAQEVQKDRINPDHHTRLAAVAQKRAPPAVAAAGRGSNGD